MGIRSEAIVLANMSGLFRSAHDPARASSEAPPSPILPRILFEIISAGE